MSISKDNLVIEKITATNYLTWKFKVEMLLIKDLFHIIEDQSNSITDAWSKSDKKAPH